jgi:phosphocarrier protein
LGQVETSCVIRNDLGLHLRAAGAFVKIACQFESDIRVQRGDEAVNGKSLLSLLTLDAPLGTGVRIVAEGLDANDAIAALGGLVEAGFEEIS